MTASVFSRLLDFFRTVLQSVQEGLLFIGGAYDIVIALIDILVLSFIFYFILKIVRDSRAWQLLKGIILIALIGIVANLSGLSSVGFVLNNTISVLAIAVIVIFQPELRRALETVGRSGMRLVGASENLAPGHEQQLIESIVTACEDMAKKRTGALIIMERTTALGDLEEQENAIRVDATVSATLLKQIFYAGSPLHDGAVLIRNGKLSVARVHIPLTDLYHLRKDLGTRHRAAMGASEIGDTVAIVVSEERGTISIALEGRLYSLDSGDALRMQLHRLFLPDKQEHEKHAFLGHRLKLNSMFLQQLKEPRKGLVLASLLLASGLWFFVQSTYNPVSVQHFQVPLVYVNEEQAEKMGFLIQHRVANVQVSLRGRKNLFDSLSSRDIRAYVDLAQIDQAGIQSLEVEVATNSHFYSRTESVVPQQITLSVRPAETETDAVTVTEP